MLTLAAFALTNATLSIPAISYILCSLAEGTWFAGVVEEFGGSIDAAVAAVLVEARLVSGISNHR